jgi:hypothetical protein
MIGIIIGLFAVLIVVVVVINAIQQHKDKLEAEKRISIAKQKAIIDETEELIINMANLPANHNIAEILYRRSFNAAKAMAKLIPSKKIEERVQEIEARLKAAADLNASQAHTEQEFVLPDNEQQVLALLQCIKKIRVTIKSEQAKGVLDAQTFTTEDQRLNAMQLKISIDSLVKRGNQAYEKEMVGSSRQYYEKALQTISDHPVKTTYGSEKHAEITNKLQEISNSLKNSNAQDREKKAKDDEDELDLLFQPKKKW